MDDHSPITKKLIAELTEACEALPHDQAVEVWAILQKHVGNLILVIELSEGLEPGQLREFEELIQKQRDKGPEPLTDELIRACHDAVTGQGVDFIEGGDAPTADPDFIES